MAFSATPQVVPSSTPLADFWGMGPTRRGQIGGGPNKYETQLFDSFLGLLKPAKGGEGGERSPFTNVNPDLYSVMNPDEMRQQRQDAYATSLSGAIDQMTRNSAGGPGMNTGVPYEQYNNWVTGPGARNAWNAPFVGPRTELGSAALGRGLVGGEQTLQLAQRDNRQRNAQQGLQATGLQTDVERLRSQDDIERRRLAIQQLGHIPGLAGALVGLLR